MSDYLTWHAAAKLLGVSRSMVPRMITRGDLTGHGRRPGGGLDLVEVEALVQRRAAVARAAEHELARRLIANSQRPAGHPDAVHDWMSIPESAERLGISRQAL